MVLKGRNLEQMNSVAEQALATWGLDQGELSFIRSGENCLYEFKSTKSEDRIIRVTENSHRSIGQLEAELHWIDLLKQEKLPVSGPIRSPQECLLHSYEDGAYHASIFEKAPGKPFDISDHWGSAFFRSLGELIGRLHRYASPSTFEGIEARPEWLERQHLRHPEASLDKDKWDALKDWAKELPTRLNKIPRNEANFGLIHADVHFGNFFVDEKSHLSLFDFDDSCRGYLPYDLIVPIASFHLEKIQKRISEDEFKSFFNEFLEAYASVASLNDQWLSHFEDFLRFRYMEIFLWFHQLCDVDALTGVRRSYYEQILLRIRTLDRNVLPL